MITPAGSHSSGNRVRVVAAPVIVLALLGLLLYKVFGGPQLSDQDQLVSILDDIRSGVARQDVGQTMGHTSSTFEASGLNRQQARLEVAQFYRMHATSSLLLRQPQIQINGSTATVQVYAELTASPTNTGGMSASAAS
ncbi:MAG: hypothetical protein LC772_13015, partial [Chloroflexi bacterium]|nr:hypothetical protein [Chloroflexota bacterium]